MFFESLIEGFLYFGFFLSGLISSSTIFLPFPIYFLILLAPKFGLNSIIAAICASIGSALGETTSYFFGYGISRYVFKNLEKNKKYKIFNKIFKKYGIFALFIFASSPIPFDFIGILCGMIKYNFKLFLLIAFIGKLIKMFLVIFIGDIILEYLGW